MNRPNFPPLNIPPTVFVPAPLPNVEAPGQEIPQEQLAPNYFTNEEVLQGVSGSYTCAVLFKVVHEPTGLQLICKALPLPSSTKPKDVTQLQSEADILRNSVSPYLVKYFGGYISGQRVRFYTEFMDCGSFDQVYKKGGRLPENVLPVVADSVLKGLKYLEDNRLIHRDIKPGNILVNRSGEVKICDFGISRILHNIKSIASTYCGTRFYMSAERLEGKGASVGADVWSLGMSLVEIAIGLVPRPVLTADQLQEWLKNKTLLLERREMSAFEITCVDKCSGGHFAIFSRYQRLLIQQVCFA